MKTFNEWLVDEHPEIMDESSWRDWAKAAALTTALAAGTFPSSSFADKPDNASVATTKSVSKDDKQLDAAFKQYQHALKLGRETILNAAERKLLDLTITNFRFLRDANGNSDQTIRNIESYLQKNQIKSSGIKGSNPTSSQSRRIQTRSESPDFATESTVN